MVVVCGALGVVAELASSIGGVGVEVSSMRKKGYMMPLHGSTESNTRTSYPTNLKIKIKKHVPNHVDDKFTQDTVSMLPSLK